MVFILDLISACQTGAGEDWGVGVTWVLGRTGCTILYSTVLYLTGQAVFNCTKLGSTDRILLYSSDEDTCILLYYTRKYNFCLYNTREDRPCLTVLNRGGQDMPYSTIFYYILLYLTIFYYILLYSYNIPGCVMFICFASAILWCTVYLAIFIE